MTTPLIPNAELVAKAWLLALGHTGKVATTLPAADTWPDDEFIQIMAVGGSPDPEVPRLNPVVTLSCFANRPNSIKPPWGKAMQLAMRIWQATFAVQYNPHPTIELDIDAAAGTTNEYGRALLGTVTAVSEIRRLPSDPSQYAVYNMDLMFSWVPASVVFS